MLLFCSFDHFLDFRAEICQIFRWCFGKFKKSKRHSEINWPLLGLYFSFIFRVWERIMRMKVFHFGSNLQKRCTDETIKRKLGKLRFWFDITLLKKWFRALWLELKIVHLALLILYVYFVTYITLFFCKCAKKPHAFM